MRIPFWHVSSAISLLCVVKFFLTYWHHGDDIKNIIHFLFFCSFSFSNFVPAFFHLFLHVLLIVLLLPYFFFLLLTWSPIRTTVRSEHEEDSTCNTNKTADSCTTAVIHSLSKICTLFSRIIKTRHQSLILLIYTHSSIVQNTNGGTRRVQKKTEHLL